MRRVAAAIMLTLGLTGALLFGGLATASATPSQDNGCYPSCPTTTPSTDPGTVTPQASGTTSTGELAFTGADIAGFVVIGLLLVGGGVLLVGATRHRRSAS